MSLEGRLKRRHRRSKCDVTLQEALCRLQERRAPPFKPVVPLHAKKSMPRHLAPLHAKCPPLSGEELTSDGNSANKRTLLLCSGDRNQLLSFPLKARENASSFFSSTGSNYTSYPLVGKFRSSPTLSAGSKTNLLSYSSNQSSSFRQPPQSDAFRAPFSKGLIRKRLPLCCLQRTPSPTKSNQIPCLMRTSQIHPQPRPPNPLDSKTNQKRRRKQRNEQSSESSVGALLQHGETGSGASQNHAKQTCPLPSPRQARTCTVIFDVPEEVSNHANSTVKSNRLQPNPTRMVVPVITIRTATPNCPAGLVVPAITIRTATPLPGDTWDPPTTEGTEITNQFVDGRTCTGIS